MFLAIPTEPQGGNHTPAFAKAAATMEAHDATITVSKGLALTAVRVLNDAQFFGQVSIYHIRRGVVYQRLRVT